MTFNLDTALFVGFLVVNIILGLGSSKGIKTIKEYAIGDRNFSTPTIVATIIATWIGGEFFFNIVSEAYSKGLNFIWIVVLGNFLCIFSMGYFFAPRMGEFLGKLSIAEAMGELFGERVRVVTSIASFIGVCGVIGTQFKIAGMITEYAIGISSNYGILIAAIIVTLYSALGGIKSVTFTDVIQFFTFSTVIPVTAYFILINLNDSFSIIELVSNSPLFDYKTVFDFSNNESLFHLFLFFFIAIPSFNPAMFQRISMSKNVMQVRISFIIASITCMFLVMILSWIGVLTLASEPNINPGEVAKFIISKSSYIIGLKGVILMGIMAMVMSTVDSYINSTSVLLVHDFFKPLKANFIRNELFSARITSILVGIFSFILSVQAEGLLKLIVATYSFYMPVVTVPFIMAILGFRSSEKSVLFGMAAGLTTVLAWDYVLKIEAVNSIPIGMVANLAVLMTSHYLLKQPGGWVGIKDKRTLLTLRYERKERTQEIINKVKEFNLIETCKRNYPRGEGMLSLLGLFVMIVTFSSVNNLAMQPHSNAKPVLDILYPLTLCSSSALISYPLWLQPWKDSKFIAVIWNFIMFFVLICFSFFTVLVSNFTDIQLIVFMMNIVVIVSLIRWQWALFNLILGTCITGFLFYYYMTPDIANYSSTSLQFKTVYLMLLASGSLILFLKPKQQHQELIEETNEHLNSRITLQDEELQNALAIKSEFLRNITHEYHASLTGVMNSAEGLFASYDQLNDKYRKMAAENIYKTAVSLKSLDDNVVTLARICEPDYKLDIKPTDLSSLVYERVENCRKYYENNKDDREFVFNIQEGVIANIDTTHMGFALDNLIMNAIKFCQKGKIIINLSKTKLGIEFSILDEGIGIPKEEIYDIFDSFKVSSKTWTPAGGRGIGLALCKGIIRKHGGDIEADSDGIKGAIFKVILPE